MRPIETEDEDDDDDDIAELPMIGEADVNFARDIMWAYQHMGSTTQRLSDAPSGAAYALMKFANDKKTQKDFFVRFINWVQAREKQRGVTEKEMLEDQKETTAALRRLKKSIDPDVDSLLQETEKLFPVQFSETMTKLGWSKRGNDAVPD